MAWTWSSTILARPIRSWAWPGRAWVKLSVPYRPGGVDPRRYVDALLDAGGPARLMWDSDFPWISHEGYQGGMTFANSLGWLDAWVPDTQARGLILRDTPARIFEFVDAPPSDGDPA